MIKRPSVNPPYPVESTPVVGSAGFLDTLAQLSPKTEGNPTSKKVLRKRAQARHFSYALALLMQSVKDSPLNYSYTSTLHCCSTLTQREGSVTGNYCNQRWCMVCNRIRVAKSINGYFEPLSSFIDAQFLTLTPVSMCADDLPAALRFMVSTWRTIYKRLKKAGVTVKGIRKLECTYNDRTREYHPHFHLIIEGKEVAEYIRNCWLELVPGTDFHAQNIRKCDTGSLRELFKYFTKVITYPKGLKLKDRKGKGLIFVAALDKIFCAMKGYRVFQPFGIKKDVGESIDDVTAVSLDDSILPLEMSTDEMRIEMIEGAAVLRSELDSVRVWYWRQDVADWVDLDTGLLLTDNSPAEWVSNLPSMSVFDSC